MSRDTVNGAGDADIALTLGDLGAGLLDAGYAVTDVQQALRAVGQVNGRTDLTIGVLPSAIMVDDPRAGRTRLVNSTGAALTFTQVADVAELARAAELGRIGLGAIRSGVRNARNRGPGSPAGRRPGQRTAVGGHRGGVPDDVVGRCP